MSAELSIVFGLGFISAALAYFAFKLTESPEDLMKKIAVLMAFMSLVFLNLVMYAVFKIGTQSATYLVNGVLLTGLNVLMWITVILVFIFGCMLFWLLLKSLYEAAKNFGKRESE